MDETADIEVGQPSAIHHIFDAQPPGRLIVFGGFGQNSMYNPGTVGYGLRWK